MKRMTSVGDNLDDRNLPFYNDRLRLEIYSIFVNVRRKAIVTAAFGSISQPDANGTRVIIKATRE